MIKKCPTCKKNIKGSHSRLLKAKFCSRNCVRFSDKAKNQLSLMRKGIPKSNSWKEKASLRMKNENNPMWKKNPGLDAIHIWVLKRKPRPKFCVKCKRVPPKDLANISQKYHRDVNDFEWLCRKCHMKSDGRLKNLLKGLNKH